MENRDDHWLLTSVLLYHKMQFVRLLLRITRTRQLVLLRLVAHLGLQFDKLLGDLVRRTLAEDSQNRPPGLVHVHPTTEREPTSTRTLQNRYLVLPRETADCCLITWSMMSLSCMTETPMS